MMMVIVIVRCRIGLFLEPAGDIRGFGFRVVQAGAEQRVPIENVDPWKHFCVPPSQRQAVGRALWALCKALAK